MQTEIRHASHPEAVRTFDTEALRRHFLVETIFAAGEIRLTYSHYDRMAIGGAMPLDVPLTLEAPKAVGQDTFLAAREIGILNVSEGAGRVVVDGTPHELQKYDCLYVGKGAIDLRFESADATRPAKFYLVSTPAHASHPTVLLSRDKARTFTNGAAETSNARSIFQYIHPEVCASCQLTLGMTMLDPGSTWNTMPSHTHDRRMESYFYFDLDEDQRIFHLMGEPQQTRHLVVAGEQAVISPPWSIHSGVGTKNYSFIWAMAGDNKVFTDMDHFPISAMR